MENNRFKYFTLRIVETRNNDSKVRWQGVFIPSSVILYVD